MKTIQKIARYGVLAIMLGVLASCASKPKLDPWPDSPPPKETTEQTPQKEEVGGHTPGAEKSEGSEKPGGYYKDDGPGDTVPANLDSTPDAQVKIERPNLRANKPYSAAGQKYIPMKTYQPYQQQGIASWYGKRFHGRKTATGETYDMFAMSAAHKTLPIPSYARVTNPANGQSVIVRINDRGPFVQDRLIDLSYAAAYKLRLIQAGKGLVEVEAIDPTQFNIKKPAQKRQEATVESIKTETASTVPPSAAETIGQYYLQMGAFKTQANSNKLVQKAQSSGAVAGLPAASVYNDGLYRVKIGPITSRAEAEKIAAEIRKELNVSAFVINPK